MPARKNIDVERLIKACRDGLTNGELCERFGINQQTVYYHLKKHGLWCGRTRQKSKCQTRREAMLDIGTLRKAVAATPKFLVCHKCGLHSIPAPEGATHQTQYVCPACSPICPEDFNFDRCQFDHAGIRPSSPGFARGARLLLNGHTGRLVDVPSARIIEAQQDHRIWALRSTRPNVMRLPEKVRDVFVGFYWSEMTEPELGSQLDLCPRQVRRLLRDGRNIISRM